MTGRRWHVYYDGDCRLCRRTVAVLKLLDWSRGCSWVAYQSLNCPPDGLTWEDLNEAVILESPSGKYFHGYFAFRELAGLLPLLSPLAPILHIPYVTCKGTRMYRWVAAHRKCAVAGPASPDE